MTRRFLSPGERRDLAALAEHPLPDETRSEGYETEADVYRLILDTFDAALIGSEEASRAARPEESEQLALIGHPSTPRPSEWLD